MPWWWFTSRKARGEDVAALENYRPGDNSDLAGGDFRGARLRGLNVRGVDVSGATRSADHDTG